MWTLRTRHSARWCVYQMMPTPRRPAPLFRRSSSSSLRNVTLLVHIRAHSPKRHIYSAIKTTKSLTFCTTTFSAGLEVLLPRDINADATYADGYYWHIHRSACINTLIYAHITSRTVPTCDMPRLANVTCA